MKRRSLLSSLTAGALTVSGCSAISGRNESSDAIGDIKLDGIRLRNETERAVEISLLLTRNSEVAYWKQHQIDGDESVPIEPPDYEYSSGEYCVFVRGSEEGTRSSVCSTEFFEEGECYYLLASRFPDGIRFSQSLSSVNCRG